METVGFIGLGKMGAPIAGNIQKAGYPMVVHDVREENTRTLVDGGARHARSPADVASQSDIIFTSLPGPNEVEAVVTGASGILAGVKGGSIYLDLSTCGPFLVRKLEAAFQENGAHIMDAPVLSPNPPMDRDGRREGSGRG